MKYVLVMEFVENQWKETTDLSKVSIIGELKQIILRLSLALTLRQHKRRKN